MRVVCVGVQYIYMYLCAAASCLHKQSWLLGCTLASARHVWSLSERDLPYLVYSGPGYFLRPAFALASLAVALSNVVSFTDLLVAVLALVPLWHDVLFKHETQLVVS